MSDQALEQRILSRMVEQLELEDIDQESFDYSTPIFLTDETDTEGLGLDSVDILELVVVIHEEFGIKVELEDMSKLRTVEAIAEYIREHA